jgi:hypothetical protein
MPERTTGDILCVATAGHPLEAHIWRQALETEGIRCQVVGEFLTLGEGQTHHGGTELWVHEADADLARAILNAYRELAVQSDDEEEDEELQADWAEEEVE